MTSPLSPVREASINRVTPPSKRKYDQYEIKAYSSTTAITTTSNESTKSPQSSPFVPLKEPTARMTDQENVSPSKGRHSRIISGTELSPLKILSEQRPVSSGSGTGEVMGPPPLLTGSKSPRKVSPITRFPVKARLPVEEHGDREEGRAIKERKISMEDMVRGNEGLKKAIEIFEDEQSAIHSPEYQEQDHQQQHDCDDAAGADTSMASTFSTFSVVPNLTLFAKLGQSPARQAAFDGTTPRAKPLHDSSARPTSSAGSAGNTTNLLMDFTDQLRFPQQHKSLAKRGNLSPSRRAQPNISISATPNREPTNLLDFDIPPMPTPRSLPSITPRELESLKSGFLSEISSLKASLSGKEAEVQSLKTAVGDAEERVGHSMEKLREERAVKDQLSAEKEDWERRGQNMADVLGKIKEELMASQLAREEMEQKLEESEKRREAAEMLHQEAESKMAGMRAGKDCEKTARDASASPDKAKATSNREVEVAVERAARELHTLYKGKHETKVAALKKSYESRWEKRVKDLESRIEQLGEENDQLRSDQASKVTILEPDTSKEAEERKSQAAKDSAAIKELNADIHRLEAVVSTVQQDNDELRTMLEKERVEKGELVQLAEEMMSMQSFVSGTTQQQQQQPPPPPQQQQQQPQKERPDPTKTPKASADREHLKSNIGRSGGSGLRMPGSAMRGVGGRISGGLPRPGTRSGIMSSIEKMGNYRGRAAQE